MLAAAAVLMLASVGAVAPPTFLHVETFDSAKKDLAYVGNTYNFYVGLHVSGPGAVRILGATARTKSPGLIQREPVIAWGCDSYHRAGIVPSDDLRGVPGYLVWPLAERGLRASDRSCPYLFVRFVPTSRGVFRASEFDIRYRVGAQTYTVSLDYEVVLNVTREGIDTRGP